MTDSINVPREFLEGLRDGKFDLGTIWQRADDLLQAPAQPPQVQGWQMPKPMAVDGMYGKDHMYSEGWNDALLEVVELNAAAPKPPAQEPVAKDAWIPVSERLPDVEKGKHKFVLVSVYRARSQRSFVFMLTFANEYEVQNDGYIDGDTEYAYLSGWYDTNDEGDFFPFVKYDEADELTHWRPLPAAPITGGGV